MALGTGHSPLDIVGSSAACPQSRVHRTWVEPLAYETANDASRSLRVKAMRIGAFQPSLERLVQQRIFVDVGQRLIDGLLCDLCADTQLPHALQHASSSSLSNRTFKSRRSHGDAAIVHGALLGQSPNRIIDLASLELPARKARAQLCGREFATGEESEGVNVRVHRSFERRGVA